MPVSFTSRASDTSRASLFNTLVATSDLYNALVERIASGTRFAARSRGSRAVTERDFAAGITTEITNLFAPSPADVLPEHYDFILDSLEHISSAARAHAKLGGGHIDHGPSRRCVRVLLFGEVSGPILTHSAVCTTPELPSLQSRTPKCTDRHRAGGGRPLTVCPPLAARDRAHQASALYLHTLPPIAPLA